MHKVINYAHRGASGYCPENTMAAFARGLELGATGIETDVQVSKDGKLVLIHDEQLKRTTGAEGLVKDYDWETLQSLDAGTWFNTDYAGEKLPSLEQLFELVKQKDTILNLELKNGFIQYAGLEEQVITMIKRYDMVERTIISSFNHYSLALCNKLAPEIQTGILYMEGLYEPWNYADQVGSTALHAFKYAVIPELVTEAAKHGKIYNPFTVNEVPEMKMLIAAGVAGIITDYPDRLAALLEFN
ncbi:glycerophosphodiester phosphodiesterase [Paenibacillus albiflavus]|uniref:Glycerophosphodiester phosphodiesterase n=1 Tax=Paenibacillus albiflavus TaxID=2545760 RepID=A0A4R4EBV9_9BACL|nr:glycerophosphodiester phosphodiesterase [Paenibacillus albiflavus]TCZ75405.1 glycerophosphodiester phosphodiesterase [Paenibacillus albiflavus]